MMKQKQVLFITYFFDPHPAVGAKRMSYWARNLNRLDNRFQCDVIATTDPPGDLTGLDNFYQVHPDSSGWRKRISIDEGIHWLSPLKQFIKDLEADYDYAVISGSPFMHFSIAKLLKEKNQTKVILDFRDPFAHNPRFDNSKFKESIKAFFEKRFIKMASHILTVNEYCLSLLEGYSGNPGHFTVIENGFENESIATAEKVNLQDDHPFQLMYAGTLFEDRSPEVLLKCIVQRSSKDIAFHHAGKPSAFLGPFLSSGHVFEYGMCSYEKTMGMLKSASAGLIITGGKPFESTSKIYDYIGLGIPILIITEGEPKTGSLHDISKDYPMVYWCKNDIDSIHSTLDKMKGPGQKTSYDAYAKSREAGLKQLIQLFDRLA